jgi:hypothetical protein
MLMKIVTVLLSLFALAVLPEASAASPVWPSPPDTARVEFVREIRFAELKAQQGVLGSLVDMIGGRDAAAQPQLPFDIVALGERLFLTCQQIPALVEIDPTSKRFRLHECERLPFRSPVSLCTDMESVYISDSESGAVYRFNGKKVEPLVTEGLQRPTGIAYMSDPPQLHVVDTGSHSVIVFDVDGRTTGALGERGEESDGFNYPTFASARDGILLINDTLNYRIKLFDRGELLTTIGQEGDGPGAFARPKGIAVDSRGNIYVVDSLYDNIQIFDKQGRILLVIGSTGSEPGQFWSPAGIDIVGDLIYIADTFNNRIQVLRSLDG